MILVDTSVWIRFLGGRLPQAAVLERLLDEGQVAGHELVYGELLIGDRGGRRELLAAYEHIIHVQNVPHREVVQFVLDNDLQGRGAGWIDIHLLASAMVSGFQLWTMDPRLAALAGALGVGY